MVTLVNGGTLYDGTKIEVIDCKHCTDMSVQAKGTGTYTVMGRLESDLDYIELTGVSRILETATNITDNQIYGYDVTTLESITLSSVTGFDKIEAVLVSK